MSETHAQTVQHLDPRALLVDLNVRHDTRLTADFVASIREQGVLQPIVAVRTPEGAHRVRFGHRRTLAAIQAGQQTVPVVVAADEATDDTAHVERLVGQYAENEHRAGLSTGERVEVMAQLAAFGVSAAQIAKRTKIRRTEVDAALAVSCSRLATAAATRYDFLDLEQAATVAEFEAEPEAVKALVAAASSGQFAHVAQRLRDERAAVQRRAMMAQQLRETGARVIDRPEPSSPAARLDALVDAAGEVLTVDSHAACPGHAAFVGSAWGYVDPSTGEPATARSQPLDEDDDEDVAGPLDDEDGEQVEDDQAEEAGSSPAVELRWAQYPSPVWVCTNPTANDHQPRHRSYDHGTARPRMADLGPEQQETARAERRDVIESNRAWASAETVRLAWLRTFLTRKTAPKGSAVFVAAAAALTRDGAVVTSVGGNHLAASLLDCDTTSYGRSGALAGLVDTTGEPRAAVLTLAVVLAGYEDATTKDSWRRMDAGTARYLRFLAANSYTLAEVERRACGDDPLPKGDHDGHVA